MRLLFLFTVCVLMSVLAHGQGCTTHYIDPTFQLTKTDPTCKENTGAIQVINQQGGVAPFVYRLIETGQVNSTGLFTALSVGTYTISSTDACGTIRTRQVTLSPFSFDFTFAITKLPGCDGGEIVIDVTPAGVYDYAVVAGADTVWSTTSTFNFPHVTSLMQIIVRDECGNTHIKSWRSYTGFLPYIYEIQHNLQCGRFDLFTVAVGFINPTYCLYQYPGNALVSCGTNPNFFDVPYGDYYIIAQDACYRDSMFQPNMASSGGVQLDPYNWDCTTFTMHVDGMEDTVCLYNAVTNQLVSCKGQDVTSLNPHTGTAWPSGAVWDSLPYGKYYSFIFDPCTDSTWRADTTVVYPFHVSLFCRQIDCSLTQSQIFAFFDPAGKKPYNIKVYWPDGTLVQNYTTNAANNYVGFPAYPGGGIVTIVGSDGCGNADTTYAEQLVTQLDKTVQITNKCPGLTGASGSGDVTIQSNAVPHIIKKNGVDVDIAYDDYSNSAYHFANLESSTYIIQYLYRNCSQIVVYDTVVIRDYVYPTQQVILINQCLNNPFTFTTLVAGGLSPYTYEIVGSTPSSPSLITAPQLTPAFTVGTGTEYSSVTVRTIDQCGNSAIGEVQVTPTENCDRVLLVNTVTNPLLLADKPVKVYPNPSPAQFTVAFNQKKKSDYKIEVTNILGVALYNRTLTGVAKKDYTISGRFVPGLYFITVTNLQSGHTSTFKQIIQ